VNERLEESRTEEALPELPPEAAPEEPATQSAWTGPAWLRLAYALEFLVALMAILEMWSQVGGQGHMDLLPWYIKLACTISLAWCCVRFTAGLVEHEKAWNHHTIVWFTGIIIVAMLMGGITYYYHLHEVPDESDTDDTTQTSLRMPAWRTPLAHEAVQLPGSFRYSSDQTRG
jgi:hypothetical protein